MSSHPKSSCAGGGARRPSRVNAGEQLVGRWVRQSVVDHRAQRPHQTNNAFELLYDTRSHLTKWTQTLFKHTVNSFTKEYWRDSQAARHIPSFQDFWNLRNAR